jgi:hypothetical protein
MDVEKTYYLCGICRMYHLVGFVYPRHSDLVEVNGRMVEPPRFVWRKPPEGAVVREGP